MYRQLEKNLLKSNISSKCPHNMVNIGPLTAEICWRVWSTPANFNGFRILPSLLHHLLGWYTIYIYTFYFRGSCPLMEFCQVQNSLCVKVLHSPILAALLHSTRAVEWASAKLCAVVSSHDRAAIPFDIRQSNCLLPITQYGLFSNLPLT